MSDEERRFLPTKLVSYFDIEHLPRIFDDIISWVDELEEKRASFEAECRRRMNRLFDALDGLEFKNRAD